MRTTRTSYLSRPATGSERRRATRFALIATTALTPLWLPQAALGQSLPTGGQVVQGAASIAQPSGSQLNVNQSSQRAVINWDGFSVGQGHGVQFSQPNSSAAVLNRVTGPLGSRIDGSITANGHVYLVNPRGVVVGPTGRVEAQGFVASSLQVDNEDFMDGRLRFQGNGASAPVVNQGTIAVAHGGMAALLGGKVTNTGTIVAPMGRIGLGAGEQATLDLSGDGFLQIAMPSGGDGEVLIDQAGLVSADGGLVEIRAATAREAARRVVNLSGVTEARSVSGRNGHIVLGGGPGGTVRVTGRVNTAPSALLVEASPRPAGRPAERPGVEITGRHIELTGATIRADGQDGGGSIRVGGDFAGGPALPTAETVTIDRQTTLSARALETGAGGDIAIWSDALTIFDGTLDTQGFGAESGGFVEVSSGNILKYDGLGLVGDGGTLLLDPVNFEICEIGECVLGESTVTPTSLVATIEAAGTATVDTSLTDDPPDSGRITVTSEVVSATGTGTLSLIADEDILINAQIDLPAGQLDIDAAEEIFTQPAGDINVARFNLNGGTWIQNSSANPDFEARDFRLGFGTTFLRATGQGTALDPFEVNDIYGLQGMASFGSVPTVPGNPVLLESVWELGQTIAAGGTTLWWGGPGGVDGFRPIGESTPFSGTFEGRGFLIDGITTRWATDGVGMFANTDGATINDLSLVSNVTASEDFATNVGGLIGFAEATTLSGVYVGGTVAAEDVEFGGEGNTMIMIGGVAGEFQEGSMDDVAFDGTVSVTSFEDQMVYAGGIAGSVSGAPTAMTNIRTGEGDGPGASPHVITVDGDGDAVVGGVFGAISTSGDSGFSIRGDNTIDVTLDDGFESFTTDSSAEVGGLVGRVGSISGVIDLAQSTSDVTVSVTQNSDEGSLVQVGGMFGDAGPATIDALTVHNVDVDVTTLGFAASEIGGFAGALDSGGTINATPFEEVIGSVTVSAEEDTFIGGLVGRNEGLLQSQDGQIDISVDAIDPFGNMETIVGGSVGINFGPIDDSYTGGTIDVTGSGQFAIGGVVGATGFVDVTNSIAGGLDPQTINVGTALSPVATDSLEVGGFAGRNFGTITTSEVDTADISVYAENLDPQEEGELFVGVGGFVGADTGEISLAFVDGSIMVDSIGLSSVAGGFAGIGVDSDFETSIADVDVSVTSNFETYAGGFVGWLRTNPDSAAGTIMDTRAFGDVTFTEAAVPPGQAIPGEARLGGFVGYLLDDIITRSASEGNTTADSDTIEVAIGGFAGLNDGSLSDVYARGDARSIGSVGDTVSEWVAGLIGLQVIGDVENAVSSGAVSANGSGSGSFEGGAIAENVSGTVIGVFYDSETAGMAFSAGGTGLTTAELQDPVFFTGTAPFDFTSIWAPGGPGAYPQIYTIDPVVYAIPDDATIVFGDDTPEFTGTVFGGPGVFLFGAGGDTLDSADVFAGLGEPGTDAAIYDLTDAPSTATSDLGQVYDIIYGVGTYTINPAPLEITTLDQEKRFGDDDFELAETRGAGWQVTSGTLQGGDITTVELDSDGEAPAADAGVYDIEVAGAVGPGVGNYDITFVEIGELSVEEILLILEIDTLSQQKVYGDTTFELAETEGDGWTIVQGVFEPGDGITTIELDSAGEAGAADVGFYPIIAGRHRRHGPCQLRDRRQRNRRARSHAAPGRHHDHLSRSDQAIRASILA